MIANIETAAIACELYEDRKTININKYIFIIFSVSIMSYSSEREKEMLRYGRKPYLGITVVCMFVWVTDTPVSEDFGRFKK